MTHTPAPWKFTHLGVENISIASETLAGATIGRVYNEADAALIAAAPELLEFAEEVRRTGDTRLASMAIAVIAKATGGAA